MPLRHSWYGRTLCNLTRQHAAKTGRPPNFAALEAPAWGFFELMGHGPRQRRNDHKDHGNGDQYSGQAKPPHWKSVMFRVAADVAARLSDGASLTSFRAIAFVRLGAGKCCCSWF